MFLFYGYAAVLQIGQKILEAFLFFGNLFFCRPDNCVGQAQSGRNGKGVAFAGNSDQKPVCGTQGCHVKFAAGVFHKGRAQGINLQFTVVGGGHGTDSPVMKVV